MVQTSKSSRSEFARINGIDYHIRLWGRAPAPKLFLLHGWMDVSASFQFLVDALQQDWFVIAPDWRGFGLSSWGSHAYYFPDYVADLDAILTAYADAEPVNLVGHSMGANVAALYAGIRPERVRQLALLEGFGLKPSTPEQAPRRYAKWLNQLADPPKFRPYESFQALAERLIQSNPRLSGERAQFLAQHWGQESASAEVILRSDPRHKIVNPVLYRLGEAQACWRSITAPVLWVRGDDSDVIDQQTLGQEDYLQRKTCFQSLEERIIDDCGHMMHHDQPERLAAILEQFFSEG